MTRFAILCLGLLLSPPASNVLGQSPPYDQFPDPEPPYYRVRFPPSPDVTGLVIPVSYTIWIPAESDVLRGVVVHQHGCGQGSCRSGLTGAYDLHWQALARRHDCALLAPSYEQPEEADCQEWCDPRNGSGAAFQRGLEELAIQCGHPELTEVPWALWGHSGGGHWAGGMLLLHPERVAAVWLRSGVPRLEADPERPGIRPHSLPPAARQVPVMCNLGTREGVTETEGRFAGVWPANRAYFERLRGQGGLVGVAVDPLTSHECGNQRYLAMPWFDACLAARLPESGSQRLRQMAGDDAWLAEPTGVEAFPASEFVGRPRQAAWLPNGEIAQKWMAYVNDTAVPDPSPPPAPTNVRLHGNELRWDAKADPESGIAWFVIERDGIAVGRVPDDDRNRFGRPLFQGLQYSDTPVYPLVRMRFLDEEQTPEDGVSRRYRVRSVNTAGLQSLPSEAAVVEAPGQRQ